MADFCKQCSEKNFGEDYKDMAGLCTEEDTKKGLSVPVLCEGCGYTYVNHLGECVGECNETHA